MKSSHGFSSENARQLIGDTLRLYVGLHKRFSWADLAAATGIKEGTLRSYVAADGPEMPFHIMVQVFSVLPIEARGRVLIPLGVAVREAEADECSTVRRALDHRERARLADAAQNLLPAIQAMADGQMH